MRATTCSPRAPAHSVSPKRVRPRMTPLTSPSDRSSALKSPGDIVVGNATGSTSSRSLSRSQPAAPMMLGTRTRFLLRAMSDLESGLGSPGVGPLPGFRRRNRTTATGDGFAPSMFRRLPSCFPIPESGYLKSLPPAPLSGSQRSPQHECLLPHRAFRAPQLARDLSRRNLLGQRFQLANVALRPLATSDLSSCSHHQSPV